MPSKSTESSESDLQARLDKAERKLRLLKVQMRRQEVAFAQMAAVFKEATLTILKASKAMKPHAEALGAKIRALMPSMGDEEE